MNVNDEMITLIKETKSIYGPIKENANLYRDLGFDSLEFMQLIIKIEEAYSISFSLTEMDQCLQLERLSSLIQEKTRGDQS